MSAITVRVQEKGQVTIPSSIRRKLNLKKGDLVMFVETDTGVVLKPAEVIVSDTLQEISRALQAKGITLDELIEQGRQIRESLVEEKP